MTLRDLAAAVEGWFDDDRVAVTARAVEPDDLATGTWQAWELELSDGTLARITVEVRP